VVGKLIEQYRNSDSLIHEAALEDAIDEGIKKKNHKTASQEICKFQLYFNLLNLAFSNS